MSRVLRQKPASVVGGFSENLKNFFTASKLNSTNL